MKKWYKVTDLAGDWIAGQRRPVDGRMQLTDEEASYELLRGVIILDEPAAKSTRKDTSK